MTTWNRVHHVGLHDTGEHADYFSVSSVILHENFIDRRGSKSEKYFEDFKTSRTFYISYTCVECGKDVMSYFASSCSLFGLTVTKEKFLCLFLDLTCLFYAFFFSFLFIFIIPQINKRLGSVSTTSPPRPAFIWGPALNWENTISALRIYFMSR